MSGVILPGVEEDRIVWERLYMEPLEVSCSQYKPWAEIPGPLEGKRHAASRIG
jgi:hypothetical protein